MKNNCIKAACMLLSLLLLFVSLISCGPNAEQTTKESVQVDVGEEEEKIELPEDHYFEGETFVVLSAGNQVYDDFSHDSEAQTVLGQAQYRRKEVILQENGAEIELFMEVNKSSYGNGPGYQKISAQAISEDVIYHLGIIGGYDSATLASGGYLYDLNSVPWVRTDKSWWDQNANNDLTINGMLFFTNGSLTAAYSESTFVIYVNNKLATQHLSGVDIYQIVKDGGWTIDQLGEFSRTVSEDLDGNGVMTYADRFGLYVWDDSILGMMGAVGSKVATVGDDGNINLTLYTNNSLNMFNKFTEYAYSTDYALTYQRYTGSFSVVTAFQEDKGLFWATSNTNTPKIRDMEASFGILPYPKLDENQERYYSTIAPYNSQFILIPDMVDEEAVNFAGVITESLAYYGKTITWPACYEDTLKGAFARDEGTMDMLDIIYGNYAYDIGYYYQIAHYNDVLLNLVRSKSTAFPSQYERYRPTAESELSAINLKYAEVLAEWNEVKGGQ